MFSRLLKGASSNPATTTVENKPRLPRPPVYEESVAMLAGSLLIYFLADLREMARAGEITSNDEGNNTSTSQLQLDPPMTTEQIMQQIQNNKDALKARAMDHEDLSKRLVALESLKEEGIFQTMFGTKQKRTIMTHFVDENGTYVRT